MTNVLETGDPNSAKMVILAGFCGSIISMKFVDGMTISQRIIAIISGMVMAHYVAPLIAFLFKEGDYVETIGFLVGLFGISIASAIFRGIQKSDLWAVIEKKLTKE